MSTSMPEGRTVVHPPITGKAAQPYVWVYLEITIVFPPQLHTLYISASIFPKSAYFLNYARLLIDVYFA